MKTLSIKGITVCGVFVSLAFVFSFFKILSLPYDISVSVCSLIFVTTIGYMYGKKNGFIAALLFGILMFVKDSNVINPLQVIIDYGLAYIVLCFSGFFRNTKFGLQLGYLFAITCRFLLLTLSEYAFMSSTVPTGFNPLAYSLLRNGGSIYIEAIISLIILSIPIVKKTIDLTVLESADTDSANNS